MRTPVGLTTRAAMTPLHIHRRASMKWIKELFWDESLSTLDNLATWALGIIGFTVFYVLLFLVMLFA
jgi:hypothetical protein